MKNSLGNPTFLVRLDETEEQTLIRLAKDFQKDSYPKTIVAVAMNYETDKKSLQVIIDKQKQENTELLKKLKESDKANKLLQAKYDKFIVALNKITDIKRELGPGFSPGRPGAK